VIEVVEVATRHGNARLHTHHRQDARASILLTHGAGGGIDSADLTYLADAANDVEVTLVEMPWRVAGRRIAPRPEILDGCWLDVLASIPRSLPVLVGGRSAGARVACRTAAQVGAVGVLALAFPLHPPGKPERSRAAELEIEVPLVVVQGESDPFGRPEEFPEVHLLVQSGAGHALRGEPLLLEALAALLAAGE
jgi:predicted alpha/beta-hydrolase family hydrolase